MSKPHRSCIVEKMKKKCTFYCGFGQQIRPWDKQNLLSSNPFNNSTIFFAAQPATMET